MLLRYFVVAAVFLWLPTTVRAQAETPLIGLLPGLIGGAAAADFNRAIVSQLSGFPLGSSAGGFTFTFDPVRQTFMRSSDSFGPTFAERAMTMGQGTFNVGATYQRATYDRVEGQDLHNGEIRFLIPDTPAVGESVEARLSAELTTDTFVWFMSYGLTDRIDVGTAVPIVRVGMDAVMTPTQRPRVGGPGPPGPGMPLPTESRTGSASGVGDVVVRTKYNFWKRTGGGVAAVVDVRLPTGDSDNLLGTAAPSGKLMFVGSTTVGRVAPHINAGYTVVGASANTSIETGDEYNYAAGVETVVTSQVTVAFDFIARTITEIGRLRLGPAPGQGPAPGGADGTPVDQLNREPGNLNLHLGSVGLKWHVGGTWLLSTSVLFPLSDAGLVDQLTWSAGFDWTR